MQSLKDIIEKELKPYLEDDDLIENDEFDFDERDGVLSFRADIVSDTIDVEVTFGKEESVVIIGDSEKSIEGFSAREVVQKVMFDITSERDHNLEYALKSPTTPFHDEFEGEGEDSNSSPSSFDPFCDFLLVDEKSPLVGLGNECNEAFEEDVSFLVRLFGEECVSPIFGQNSVTFHLDGHCILSDSVREAYGLRSSSDFLFDLCFEFFVSNREEEEYFFCGDRVCRIVTKVQDCAFREQMVNLCRLFLEERYRAHKVCLCEDVKLCSVLGVYRTEEQRRACVGLFLKEGLFAFSVLLCVFFCDMDVEKGIAFFLSFDKSLLKDEEFRKKAENIRSFLKNQKKKNKKNKKRTNFLLVLFCYVNLRLLNLCSFCCICDSFLSCQEDVKPSICTQYRCQFEYIFQGVCRQIPQQICLQNVSKDLQENPNVVDILISLFYTSARHHRRDIICDPFPEEDYLRYGKRDYDALIDTLDQLPPVQDMVTHAQKAGEMGLKKALGQKGYNLLQWICSVQRGAMVRMTQKKKIQKMNSDYQYMLMMEDPQKMKEFHKVRDQYGSFFAFHGSGMENWHSILRKGLLVGSNTKYQTTGAAFGQGIYMSPRFSTSWGYSRPGQSWPHSRFGSQNVRLMTICEVAQHPSVDKVPHPHYVIKHPQYVVCRFFIWYRQGTQNSNIDVKELDLHDKYFQGKGKKTNKKE